MNNPWDELCIGDRVEVTLEAALLLLRKQGYVANRFELPEGNKMVTFVHVLCDDGFDTTKREDEVKYLGQG